MGNFKRFARARFSGRGSDRPSRRDSSSFSRDEKPARRFDRGSSDRPERRPRLEMFEATCDKCKRRCEVPFRPSGAKPVYCSDCFRKNESFEPRNESPSSSSSDLDQINRKLDKILKLLESN